MDSAAADINTPQAKSAQLKESTPQVNSAPRKKRSHLFHIIVLSLLMLAMALPGISTLPVIDRDEARYAVASIQMAESGDLVSIRFQDDARNKKPAGSYWAQTAMIKLLSKPGERKIWVQRIPSVIAALIAVLATYWAGLPILGRRGAFISAAFLAVSGLVVFEAHMAKTDALLLASSALMLVSLVYLRQGGGRGFALLFWISIGLAAMIKGPVIPALAILTLLPLWIWERKDKTAAQDMLSPQEPSWMRKLLYWPGPILCLLIILPWSIMIWQATDGQFFKDALGGDFGKKLVGAQEKHGGLPGYYLGLMSFTFWPGVLFLLPGFAFALRAAKGGDKFSPVLRGMRLLLCFALPFWVVLELVPTKLPNYLLPIYPALALMVGGAVITLLATREFKWSRPIGAVLFIIAGIIIVAAALLGESIYGPASRWPYGLGIAAVLCIFAAGGAVFVSKPKLGLIAAFLSAMVISPILYQFLVPSLSDMRLADRIVSEIRGQNIKLPREGGPAVFAHNFTEPSLVYHLGTKVRLGDQIKLDSSVPPGTVLIVDVARQDGPPFLKSVTDAGLCMEEFAKFDGHNYSRGDPVTLKLSQVVICPAVSVNALRPSPSN